MKIKADYTNSPSWRMLTVKATLPEELKCLDEIAHNMWWVWNFEARDLFRDLDPELYHDVKHNPVMLLEERQGADEARQGSLCFVPQVYGREA